MKNTKRYKWLITVGDITDYGSFKFEGTEKEAEEKRRDKANWEHVVARKKIIGLVEQSGN